MKRDSVFEDDVFDEFSKFEGINQDKKRPRDENVNPIHSDNWTIVDAFNVINEELPKSQLEKGLFVKCAEAFEFLSEALGFNSIQCVIIAMLVEKGQAMSFRQMGQVLGLSRLSMMTHFNEFEKLFEARWLIHRGAREKDGMYEGYCLAHGVVTAIRENRPFVPEPLDCKDTQEFVEKLASHIDKGFRDDSLSFEDEKHWLMEFVRANKDLPVCQTVLKLLDNDSIIFLMLAISDYCNYYGASNEGIGSRELQIVYQDEASMSFRYITSNLKNGSHELFRQNLIEHKCEDGLADTETYVLSKYMKDDVLSGFTPTDFTDKAIPKMNGFKKNEDIVGKTLFYNEREGEQVKRLQAILSQEQLPLVQERLREKGLRTGVCILLHGAPGTGKTATAYELASQTGRDIIQVQVTDFTDKYVGESEAKLKNIFDRYRLCCMNSEVAPILLLNEGDAILSKRTTNVERSVDQMSNALQNILLEEMEYLDGIMIVTTNLTTNLDSAFERRFIFKIQFDKPNKNVKAHIWESMIGGLDAKDSMTLAELYDISGGEIENIARKTIMEYAITGQKPDLQMINKFAREEKLAFKSRTVVGFGRR